MIKLPKSKKPLTGIVYNSILIIINRLTKYMKYILYKKSSNTEELVYTFLRQIVIDYRIARIDYIGLK